ncbi:MAG TPA: GTPase HflX [Acidimicrobiia bacterium]|jgi:GTP-binding protein HflX
MTSERESNQGRQRRRLTATVTDLAVARQRALLVGVVRSGASADQAERSLAELALLVDTAGAEPIDSELVKRGSLDPALYIGKGKAGELASVVNAADIDVVVFDNELTPAQQRNLQQLFGVDVVDREALILDIFAQHARSRVGAIQVELALLRYNLPRLRGKGISLSQQTGGIGARRGPGETKLELDRRRIQKRISRLERDLAEFRKTRQTQSKARLRTGVPMISLVGYTNAGKSTLLNQLTAADVLAEDRLFSTLDSTVRKFTLPDGRPVLLSDTVGFVRRLPHHLIEAFRSTLEQVRESALLVHMVDASDAEPEEQIAAVREVLDEIGASDVAELLVLNKSDVADPATLNRLTNLHPEAVVISARTGTGLTELGQAISDRLRNTGTVVRLEIPYDRADILAAAHRDGEVMAEKHDENGSVIEVRLPAADLPRFQPFVASS